MKTGFSSWILITVYILCAVYLGILNWQGRVSFSKTVQIYLIKSVAKQSFKYLHI